MDRTGLRNKYAIAGVGYTPQGKVPGRSAASFYLEASMNAINDAGLKKEDIDGLILYRDFPILKGDAFHHTANVITKSLGIRPNFLSQESYCYRTFLHKAIGVIEAGTCKNVLVVFAESGRTGHRTWTDEIDTFSATSHMMNMHLMAIFPLLQTMPFLPAGQCMNLGQGRKYGVRLQ